MDGAGRVRTQRAKAASVRAGLNLDQLRMLLAAATEDHGRKGERAKAL